MAFIKEACVEGLDQAIVAQKLGADRIEFCANLAEGGTTPDFETIKAVLQKVQIPIRVMIRPRAGNFLYSEEELQIMENQIESFKSIGVEGVVFGVLNQDNTLNIEAINRLIDVASPLKIVVHKAIDLTPNILESLEDLKALNKNITILTSGGAENAEKGKKVLKQMLKIASNKIDILPAGRITADNVQKLHKYLLANAYHGREIVGPLSKVIV